MREIGSKNDNMVKWKGGKWKEGKKKIFYIEKGGKKKKKENRKNC